MQELLQDVSQSQVGEEFSVFLTTSITPDPRIYSPSIAMVMIPIVNLFSIAWMAGKISLLITQNLNLKH